MMFVTLTGQVREHVDALTRLRSERDDETIDAEQYDTLCAQHVLALEQVISAVNGLLDSDEHINDSEREGLDNARREAKDPYRA